MYEWAAPGTRVCSLEVAYIGWNAYGVWMHVEATLVSLSGVHGACDRVVAPHGLAADIHSWHQSQSQGDPSLAGQPAGDS